MGWPAAYTSSICTRCGKHAQGFATINEKRYCHGDDTDRPSCYELTNWEISRDPDLLNGQWTEADRLSAASRETQVLHGAVHDRPDNPDWPTSPPPRWSDRARRALRNLGLD